MPALGFLPAYTPPQFESSAPLVLVRGVDVRTDLYSCSSSIRALFAQWAGAVGLFCAGVFLMPAYGRVGSCRVARMSAHGRAGSH